LIERRSRWEEQTRVDREEEQVVRTEREEEQVGRTDQRL
jgi:hypothetical protein